MWYFTPWQLVENAGITVKRHRQANPAHLTLFFFSLFVFSPLSYPGERSSLSLSTWTNFSSGSPRLASASNKLLSISPPVRGRRSSGLRIYAPLPAQRIPLPDPRVQATKLLPKLTPHDDVEAFLQMFESIATTEGWHPDDWARVLAPLLTGEAQRAYFALPADSADQYVEVKKEILARLGLSPICAAQHFHEWEYKPRLPARAQAAELTRLAQHWLLEGSPSAGQVAERVVVDRFLRALPRSHRQAVGMKNPTTTAELVEAIELADAAQQRDAGERAPPFPRRVVQERRAPEGTQRPLSRPGPPSPRDEPMPTEAPPGPARTWLAGCIIHRDLPAGAPEVDVRVNGRRTRAILDSGSAVSLVKSHLLSPRSEYKTFLPITCVHGDTRQVPARKVTISAGPGTWPIEVGVMKNLPVPVLIGRDWPGFDLLLATTTQPASPPQDRRRRRPRKGPCQRPVLLASDSGREGESPSQNTNLFYDVFQQVSGGGSLGREQREDDRLKHCWTQVRVIEGKEVQPSPHPLPHFVVQNGLLYCVAQRRGEEKWLLVLPRTKTETVLELAHSHPMAGHLGAANTVQRVRDRFHWPGLEAEVKAFCQACPTCQRTSPRVPPPSPLIPLPIIGVPFERIGMDLVGPLPKSARGHEHILVIVDYATRYPEAVPLRKATAKAIAQELFLLSSRVGIPAEILTDQGTPFMSRLMADLCRLLRVKQLRTTVYHPQTDGLVERLNLKLLFPPPAATGSTGLFPSAFTGHPLRFSGWWISCSGHTRYMPQHISTTWWSLRDMGRPPGPATEGAHGAPEGWTYR